MGDRGPSQSYDYDDVAFLCRKAYANNQPMGLAVSAEYGIDPLQANRLISRVRRAGYMVPLVRPDLVSDDPAYLPPGSYEDLFTPEPWTADAECKGMPTSWFFPEKGADWVQCRAVCDRCVVKADCLDAALRRGEKFGCWGGTSERERRGMRREIRVEAHSAA